MISRTLIFAVCLLGLSYAQNETTAATETLDDVHISCDTLEYMAPNVTVMALDDDVNGTDSTANVTKYDYDYSNQTDPDFVPDYNYTDYTSDNESLIFNESFVFNDEVLNRLADMGFPFRISCRLSGDYINMSLTAVDNSTQIVEILAQVDVNGTISGLFLAPELFQDYRTGCLEQAVTQLHNDPKEVFYATWYNSEGQDLNDTVSMCRMSILDSAGNFWYAISLQATNETDIDEDSTVDDTGADGGDMEFTAVEFEMKEDKTTTTESAATTTGSMEEDSTATTAATSDEAIGEEATTTAAPATTTAPVTTTETDNSTAMPAEEVMEAAEEKPAEATEETDSSDMGDLGQIVVDGETYQHHCINNNMIRVLVPYTGCSDFITVVGGLPRSYQTCGLDKCFDVESCGCKQCEQISCEKLAPGTSQSYSISIYNTEGKEVGTVSGERTRTATGGLTESISAEGDPRSSLFPIDM